MQRKHIFSEHGPRKHLEYGNVKWQRNALSVNRTNQWSRGVTEYHTVLERLTEKFNIFVGVGWQCVLNLVL